MHALDPNLAATLADLDPSDLSFWFFDVAESVWSVHTNG